MKAMTKKQLIEALAAYEDDALILMEDAEEGFRGATLVVEETVVYHRLNNHWQSDFHAVDRLTKETLKILDQFEPFKAVTILFSKP